jgi:uncharacterized protein YegP (UPF0339 family)
MSGTGEYYKREDGKWAFRVQASNGNIVATDGSQGYSNEAEAKDILTRLMRGDFNGTVAKTDK